MTFHVYVWLSRATSGVSSLTVALKRITLCIHGLILYYASNNPELNSTRAGNLEREIFGAVTQFDKIEHEIYQQTA